MSCAGCGTEICRRRNVRLAPRLQYLCATRSDYAAVLDKRHGVADDTIISDSGRPDDAIPKRSWPPEKSVHVERVGDMFGKIVASLGISKLGGCGCNSAKHRMNQLGVAGCRLHREELIAVLRKNARKVGWTKKLIAVPLSVWNGLAFSINPIDPLPGLFDEAVRMSESLASSSVT